MGSYGNSDIPEPLMNLSQIIGIYPNDTIAPCIPIELHFGNITSIYDCWEFVEDKPCDFKEYFNEIYWERDLSGNCDPDNSSFNIYFSNVSVDGPYEIIANVTDTFFIHNHLESFAGCYRVSSLDNAGNESEPSDPICHDNCPYYELPNVFTPNGDGKNDTFQAFDKPTAKCPRFVHDVHFRVYNRDGFEVYNSDRKKEANIYINWNGSDFTGKMLPAGTYFYIAEVNFISIDPQLAKHVYKGWVQLLR
jgi:gliding motility-associated-like protein